MHMAQRIKRAARSTLAAAPRDIIKTISFAWVHFSVAFGVTFALTGSVSIATGVSLIEPLLNTIAFYLHERAWTNRRQAVVS
jgi:uncharacterized membrane protein